MQTSIPSRVCRTRHYAELTACLAYAAELRGDAKEASRLTLDAWLMEARAEWLDRRIFGEIA